LWVSVESLPNSPRIGGGFAEFRFRQANVADEIMEVLDERHQAQIIAFSQDYQMVMLFTLCAIPLAIMIGSTKAALRKQSQAPEHAVIE
jgi:hypothetical protein